MGLLVTCRLASPLAGDPPYLDSLLEHLMALLKGESKSIRRDEPCPEPNWMHIPMAWATIGGHSVPQCSAPVMSRPTSDRHEHYAKRFAADETDLVAADQRRVIAIGNGTLKSYRLPNRVRRGERVSWLCRGHRRPILQLLRRAKSIGKDRSQGYGRVAEWSAEYVSCDDWWFSPSEHGSVLMRALPACEDLPRDLVGYRRDFGACVAPLWHPDRNMELVVPC